MILLDSLYINNSGGKVLLEYLVSECENRNLNIFYLFDDRCINDFKNIPNERKTFLEASIIKRTFFYKKEKSKFSSILCFGNIPPTIKVKVPVYTYFHHGGILSDFPFPVVSKLKMIFKKRFITLFSKNTTYFIFQSQFVKNIFHEKIRVKNKKSLIIPFYKEIRSISNKGKDKNKFLYVSSGSLYKNHLNLFKAWEILAINNLYPELHLTVTQDYPMIISLIDGLVNKGIKIKNHGFTNVIPLYEMSKFLIFPSFIETFGLGLIEGAMSGCQIIASDKEYVYSVIHPSKTFNPANSESIAKSVMEIMNGNYKKTTLIVENEIDQLIELISNETNDTRP